MSVATSLLMQINLAVGQPLVLGPNRRSIPIVGGTVTGCYIGEVMAGGADWQQIGSDGTIEIDARYVLKLAQGMVEVSSKGLRAGPPDVLERLGRGELVDPSLYYFRTSMRFHSGVPDLQRLNHILAISIGERLENTVRLSVYEVA